MKNNNVDKILKWIIFILPLILIIFGGSLILRRLSVSFSIAFIVFHTADLVRDNKYNILVQLIIFATQFAFIMTCIK